MGANMTKDTPKTPPRLNMRSRTIGSRVRLARSARGWSQDQLAEACACSQNRISRLERGDPVDDESTLIETIAGALNLAATDIDPRHRKAKPALVGKPTAALEAIATRLERIDARLDALSTALQATSETVQALLAQLTGPT